MNVPVFSAGNNLIPTVRWNNSHFLADSQASENEIAAASFFLSFPGCARCQRRQRILSAFPMSWAAAPTHRCHLRPRSSLSSPACCDLGLGFFGGHPEPCFLDHVLEGFSRPHTCSISTFTHSIIHSPTTYLMPFLHSLIIHSHPCTHSLIPPFTCSLFDGSPGTGT